MNLIARDERKEVEARQDHYNQLLVMIGYIMVLILDGNSEMYADVRRNLCYLISLRHLIRRIRSCKSDFFSPKSPIFFHVCGNVLSYHII